MHYAKRPNLIEFILIILKWLQVAKTQLKSHQWKKKPVPNSNKLLKFPKSLAIDPATFIVEVELLQYFCMLVGEIPCYVFW